MKRKQHPPPPPPPPTTTTTRTTTTTTTTTTIPSSVRDLTFGKHFNKLLPQPLPPRLQKLTLGRNFNRPIGNATAWSASLEEVTFGEAFVVAGRGEAKELELAGGMRLSRVLVGGEGSSGRSVVYRRKRGTDEE
ncbi:unnamed protein product [Sphacelaria rigidula]